MGEIYKVDSCFNFNLFSQSSCAFGVFDGVHRGHQYLLQCAQDSAKVTGGRSIALTFDVDPDEIFDAQNLKKLLTNEERFERLAQSGVDAVVVLPFTKEFAIQTPERFLERTFGGALLSHLHVGFDFRFGSHAAGSVMDLTEWGSERGVEICGHVLKNEDDMPISATRIRGLLAEGNIEQANTLLGYTYFVKGVVEQGRGEGADMGFRTANFVVSEQRHSLSDGVYAAYSTVDGVRYKTAVNVGVAATFADRSTATFEAHLLDFEGNLYGREIMVEFTNWLRPMKRFDDIDELVATVQENIDWVRMNL